MRRWRTVRGFSSCWRCESLAGAEPERGRRSFTLLEVMLAVALSTMLLVAVNFFVLSLGELWSGGSEERLFDRHVRGVGRFLETLVAQSVVPTGDATGATDGAAQAGRLPSRRPAAPLAAAAGQGGPTAPRSATVLHRTGRRLCRWVVATTLARAPLGRELGLGTAWALRVQAVPDRGGRGRLPRPVRAAGPDRPPANTAPRGNPPGAGGDAIDETTGARFRFGTPSGYEGGPLLLMFELDEAPGQCVWPHRPLPQVECALQVNADEGLVLLWKSKLEDDYGEARPRKTQLSPFGRALSFDYYDTERGTWSRTEQPQADGRGGWLVPQRVRVAFAYQGIEREISITLPEAAGGAPLR